MPFSDIGGLGSPEEVRAEENSSDTLTPYIPATRAPETNSNSGLPGSGKVLLTLGPSAFTTISSDSAVIPSRQSNSLPP